MRMNRKITRLAASVLASALLVCGAALPAMADDTFDNSGVVTTHGTSVSINQTIDVSDAKNSDESVNSPVVTFTYTLASNNNLEGSSAAIPVHAGILPNDTSLTCVFNGTDTNAGTDNLLKNTFSVDFTDVTWTGVGVYRYTLTQSNDNQAVSLDNNTIRYLDVYVGADGSDGYQILNYVLTSDGNLTYNSGNHNYTHGTKSAGFTATYKTYALKVKQYITGTLGDKNDTFTVTVNFTNLPAGVTLHTDNNASTSGSSVTQELSADDILTIEGIPTVGNDGNPVTYTASEKFLTEKAYSTQYELDTDIGQWQGNSATDATRNEEDSYTTMSTSALNKGATTNVVEFNNSRDAVTPTGVILNVAPYVLMVVIAVAAAFVFLRKRRED